MSRLCRITVLMNTDGKGSFLFFNQCHTVSHIGNFRIVSTRFRKICLSDSGHDHLKSLFFQGSLQFFCDLQIDLFFLNVIDTHFSGIGSPVTGIHADTDRVPVFIRLSSFRFCHTLRAYPSNDS